MDQQILSSLRKLGRELKADKDKVIHSPLESCLHIGFILRGSLRMSKIFSSGKELIIRTLFAGEMYGELVCFSGGTYPCWIVASEDSRVFEIPKDNLFDLFQEKDFLVAFLADISKKSRILNDTIEILSLKRIGQRIAYYLLSLRDAAGSSRFPLGVSMSGLAHRLGSSREAVSRGLKELCLAGVVEKTGGDIRINDGDRLESLLTD